MTNVDHIYKNIPNGIEDSEAPWTELVDEDYHVLVYKDKYPVSEGHLLFVPKYNTMGVLRDAFEDAVRYGRNQVDTGKWQGFNVGMNYGKVAGQTVNWPHIHVIPRTEGDCEDPIGGVRNVIPGRGNYKKW
jgi:diadenosine tetraphosphate (Ap4A) HIT family hydrolase